MKTVWTISDVQKSQNEQAEGELCPAEDADSQHFVKTN